MAERILVVDDLSMNLKVINSILERLGGFEMHGVNHGDAALEHLATSPRLPDLVLTDVQMPGVSGLELLAAIKSNPQWTHIPVILMTGEGSAEEEKCLAMGAADFVEKPLQAGALLLRIRTQIDIQAIRNQKKILESTKDSTQHTLGALQEYLSQMQQTWSTIDAQLSESPLGAGLRKQREEIEGITATMATVIKSLMLD